MDSWFFSYGKLGRKGGAGLRQLEGEVCNANRS